MKYSFFNDYSEGAHPNILKKLAETNLTQEAGYGLDAYTLKATELIKEVLHNKDADIHFVSGGTQANLIVLASMMKPYEAVIAANTAHIFVHEAGAIESTGHKILTYNSNDGKLTVEGIKELLNAHTDEHMVKPKVVFISQSTEVGTIYSKSELEAISEFCKESNLYLYLDGARLGSGLQAANMNLSDISNLVDAFYIGGTKNGALFGEAIVVINKDLQKDFRFHLKQRGALLAKGRAVGVQFLELFESNLYFDLATHANKMASKLTTGIKDLGYGFLSESTTNQIFPIFSNEIINRLQESYGFYVWAKVDNEKSAIRLVTSWATEEKAIDGFIEDLKNL